MRRDRDAVFLPRCFAASTMMASDGLSSQSSLLTQEIRTYLDHARENLVDQAGAAKRAC
jgi:hypothetical protein